MTDLQTQINENADSLERLLEIIKTLEERVIKLELLLLQCDSTKVINLPDDHWYWEHG
jgi:enamine deaminase RidA (YjgF/YER057c/UK114 family)